MNQSEITINNVWQNKSDELIQEIIAFWKSHRVIPSNVDIDDRARQVVLAVRNEEEQIVGVTTSYLTKYAPLKNTFFVFRGMLAPEYRIPGLFIKMTIASIQILEKYSSKLNETERPIGVLTEIENPGLKKTRMTKSPSGMTLIGFSAKGNPMYVYYFKGARF